MLRSNPIIWLIAIEAGIAEFYFWLGGDEGLALPFECIALFFIWYQLGYLLRDYFERKREIRKTNNSKTA